MSTQIHDLGYRAYQGERAGTPWAVRSLAVHSMRRALGLKRAARHKIVPAITIVLAYLPAVVLVGLAAFISDFGVSDLAGYGDYYGFIYFALMLFTAASAPGVLTTDRTTGMLAMYLASPLTRTTYVLAKYIGLFVVMLLVTLGPILFLLIAYTLVGAGPGGIVDFLELFGRALFAGALTAAFFTGLGMLVSSIPKRWSIASVAIIGLLIVPSIIVGILVEGIGAPEWFRVLAPAEALAATLQHAFGDSFGPDPGQVSATTNTLASVAFAAVFAAATWWRYQSIEVDR